MTWPPSWLVAAGALTTALSVVALLPDAGREIALAAPLLLAAGLMLHRRLPHLALALHAVVGVLGIWLSAGFLSAALNEGRNLQTLATEASRLSAATASLAQDDLAAPALADLTPVLDKLAQMAEAAEVRILFPLPMTGQARSALQRAYAHALAFQLRPHLILWTETRIATATEDPARLLRLLQAYLVLGLNFRAGSGAEAAETLLDEMRADPMLNDDLARAMSHHLAEDAWLNGSVEISLDLVDRARMILRGQSVTWLAYLLVREGPEARSLPDVRLSEIGGPRVEAVFQRRSGVPLDMPIPGFFTREGFHDVFLPALSALPETLRMVSAVIDLPVAGVGGAADHARVARDLIRLYESEYIATWEGLLFDLRLAPVDTPVAEERQAKALATADSPIYFLLSAVDAESRLTEPPPGRDATAAGRLAELTRTLGTIAKAPEEAVVAPGAAVEAHFAPLRQLLEPDIGGQTALQRLLDAWADLVNALTLAAMSGEALPPDHPARLTLNRLAATLPPPLPDWTTPAP